MLIKMINPNLFVKFVQFIVKKWVVGGIDMILHFNLSFCFLIFDI